MKNKPCIPVYYLRDFCKAGLFSLRRKNSFGEQLPVVNQFNVWTPYLSDYYLFYFVQSGTLRLMVDFQEIVLEGPLLFFVLPRQVKCALSETNVTAWSLAVDPSMLKEQLASVFEEELLNPVPIPVPEEIHGHLEGCMEVLHNISKSREEFMSIQQNLASSCIAMFAEAYRINGTTNKRSDKRKVALTHQFYTLLRKNYRKEKSPSWYAAALNITVSYLNECVKAVTGMPVSYWIQQEIVLAAKRLLYHTKFSVKEIAYDLGFNDPTHLSRMFIKGAGITPRQFRDAHR